jgi:propanol-preferring alcohol dehydrogenase
MLLDTIAPIESGRNSLKFTEMDKPKPSAGQILLKVSVCGVCHTDMDEIEGRLTPPHLPIVPGHQVVGEVIESGPDIQRYNIGDRVGVAWIYSACGTCALCQSGQENLCMHFRGTGKDAHGGYAEYMVVPEDFAYQIPQAFSDPEAAPLLCAGAVGYRSFRLAGIADGQILGLTGFGASAHIVLKLVLHYLPETPVYVFARNPQERAFALEIGAAWAGDTTDKPPHNLDAMIDTTPAWKPVVEAMRFLNPGGRLVINAIRKEAGDKDYLQRLDYATHLWMEKEIKSVANVTRKDVAEFLAKAAGVPIKPTYQEFALPDANAALLEMKQGRIRGAKVLRVSD